MNLNGGRAVKLDPIAVARELWEHTLANEAGLQPMNGSSSFEPPIQDPENSRIGQPVDEASAGKSRL
jgi:hypothetical protein